MKHEYYTFDELRAFGCPDGLLMQYRCCSREEIDKLIMTLESKVVAYLKKKKRAITFDELLKEVGQDDAARLKIREMILCGTIDLTIDWKLKLHKK